MRGFTRDFEPALVDDMNREAGGDPCGSDMRYPGVKCSYHPGGRPGGAEPSVWAVYPRDREMPSLCKSSVCGLPGRS